MKKLLVLVFVATVILFSACVSTAAPAPDDTSTEQATPDADAM